MTVPTKDTLEQMRKMSSDHVRRYIESNGEDGHVMSRAGQDITNLLLTTTGRRSGEKRTTPLIYGRDGDRYLIVASMGGADQPPNWYLNLVEHPQVEVQVGAERFAAVARAASPEEKPALWKIMTAIFPTYDQYQASTERDIPVVILERQ